MARTYNELFLGDKVKKINSIGYGAKIVSVGVIFLLIIPGILYIISLPLDGTPILINLQEISVLLGILVFIFLIVLLGIELWQDKRINSFHLMNRASKSKISNNYFECQNCGNQKLHQNDKSCPICGVRFKGALSVDAFRASRHHTDSLGDKHRQGRRTRGSSSSEDSRLQ